ncbi:unnamed protein product, partial [Psylliodes chrysocephalus]
MNNNVHFILISVLVLVIDRSEQTVDLKHVEYVKSVFPRVNYVRKKRSIDDKESVQVKVVKVGDWLLELHSEDNLLFSRGLRTEWLDSSEDSHGRRPLKKCDYHVGVIKGLEADSKVVVTLCGIFVRGYLDVDGDVYFLEPVDETTGEHIVYRSKHYKKRSTNTRNLPSPNQWIFNLTGDTIDIEEDIETTEKFQEAEELTLFDPGTNGTEMTSIDDLNWGTAKNDVYGGGDENGYFYDTAWTANTLEVKKSSSGSLLPPRWMEIAVAVDHTLISFHGRARVEEYVLSLLNIVSAIYQDTSLESNMKLVVTRLLMYESKKFCHRVIKIGNAKKSLENVNSWNKAIHASLAADEPRHDLAIWLTRSDIGGPSGYAPVAGVCDPKRSCALNRDEGLTSAFIIAHETAHIKWLCLLNPPTGVGEISLNATLQASFTMDQQCRMEFGDGYTMCRSFEIIEPCSHLWCGHENSPLVCKTKKGPPLEGTECGFGKWCVNGYCENFANRRVERVPIVLNPQDGQWTDWSPWGPCSRTCGIGVQFRTRKCQNPPPSFGGKLCEGQDEEWHLCKINNCVEPTIDIRAQQCKHLPKFLNLSTSSSISGSNFTWLPYESDENSKKCKLICFKGNKKELYFTNENLIDGTPCSYDHDDNICVQGLCQYVGCDGVIHSPLQRDKCGICNGNNSDCTDMKKTFHRRLKKESSRIAVLPEKSREIKVQLNATKYHSDNPVLALILKNRKKKSYTVMVPSGVPRSEIVKGAKFYYKRNNNNAYTIWSKGPIRDEMVVLVIVSKTELRLGINISYSTEFSIQKDDLIPSKRFVWIAGGWGPCSTSCGGGKRQRTAACFDNNTNKVVKRSECALIQKPKLEFEMCNTFSCNFKWFTAEWEPCSTSCGTLGVQHREIYCLPNSVIEETNGTISQPWRYMANPNRCGGIKSVSMRSCNRKPCFSYWTFGNWTQCSATCGPGFQTRSSHCLPPEDETFFTCGNAPSPQRKSCLGNYNRFTNPLCRGRKKKICHNDESVYCPFGLLHKYCKISGFKRMCCKSCESAIFTNDFG